jgi:hypothetical protein
MIEFVRVNRGKICEYGFVYFGYDIHTSGYGGTREVITHPRYLDPDPLNPFRE